MKHVLSLYCGMVKERFTSDEFIFLIFLPFKWNQKCTQRLIVDHLFLIYFRYVSLGIFAWLGLYKPVKT